MPQSDLDRPDTTDPSFTPAELVIMGLARLTKFYGYKDVLREVYGGDEDAFTSGWCDGSLPAEVRETILATLDPARGQMLLLRRIVRQQDELLTVLRGQPHPFRKDTQA